MSNDWKQAALHLANTEAMSWRDIAKAIEKPRSTVSDYLRTAITTSKGPRIGVIDIETSPTLAWVWRRWKENIFPRQVESETIILSCAIKELGNDSVDFLANWQVGDVEDDETLVRWIAKEMEKYDVLIAHNGDKFDFPIINTRMVYYGLTPPAPYKTVDTLKTLKKRFRFPSNGLDAVCGYLGLGTKTEHEGFNLWKRVMHHDPAAFAIMEEYNIHDVVLLEELYLYIRAWENTHPSLAIRTDSEDRLCNACGSSNITMTDNKFYTSVSMFSLYQCDDCGHWHRTRKNEVSKDKLPNLGMSVK